MVKEYPYDVISDDNKPELKRQCKMVYYKHPISGYVATLFDKEQTREL